MEELEWKDCMGQDIHVGDIVAYGIKDGNHGTVLLRRVTELTVRTKKSLFSNDDVAIQGWWSSYVSCEH